MITEDTATWPLWMVPLGSYLGYSIALKHAQNHQYRVSITCPWEFGGTISDRTFSLEKKDEAMQHAHELIDQEVSSILPY